ncbi:MAG: SOS response-associated peptidase family protein [Eubacteriales bacterium]|nr:SOS response-associated peptidase family protein [Eubacteriales bacterium]
MCGRYYIDGTALAEAVKFAEIGQSLERAGAVRGGGLSEKAESVWDSGLSERAGAVRSGGFSERASSIRDIDISGKAGFVWDSGFLEKTGSIRDSGLSERAGVVRGGGLSEKEDSVRDIHPSEKAHVLYVTDGHIHAGTMAWSFPGTKTRGLLFNVRCETILNKGWFREDIRSRRCVIPAAGFYEWDKRKNKVSFRKKQEPALYMAGFYEWFQEEPRFVILTTAANPSVIRVHDRMPLILEKEEVRRWLLEGEATAGLLKKTPGELEPYREYEQQTLPFC